MLECIELGDPNVVKLLEARLFGQKIKIKFDDIMKGVGLEDIAKRVSFEEIPNRKSHIHPEKPIEPKKNSPMKIEPARESPGIKHP